MSLKKLYIEVELCDGGDHDVTFGRYYYGPLDNSETKEIFAKIKKIHEEQNDGRCYTKTSIIPETKLIMSELSKLISLTEIDNIINKMNQKHLRNIKTTPSIYDIRLY